MMMRLSATFVYNRQKQVMQFVDCPIVNSGLLNLHVIDGGKSYTDWDCTECKMQIDVDEDILFR